MLFYRQTAPGFLSPDYIYNIYTTCLKRSKSGAVSGASIVDYAILSCNLYKFADSFTVLTDVADGMSKHRPLLLTLKIALNLNSLPEVIYI